MAQTHIHFIGIGGISLSALAIILKDKGYIVTGSDVTNNQQTKKLQKLGITVYIGHNKNNVVGADIVVYSSAIHADNPEIINAKALGLTVISRAQLLGKIADQHKNVLAISGTHGKTTATGMLASVFISAKKDPTVHIGGNLPLIKGNVRVGGKDYFITEACEYCDSFLNLKSKHSVILNIQKDHMDYFKKISNLQNSFKNFAKNTINNGFLIINGDDKLCNKLGLNQNLITFGLNPNNHFVAKNLTYNKKQQYSYNLYVCGYNCGKISLGISGKHNVYNSLAVIAVSLLEGISLSVIKKALITYKSSERRFQKIKHTKAMVVHDYAHHPTEIMASLSTAKNMCKGKLIVVFQPHTYTRTQYLWKDFCECFKGADKVYLCPIYPAREIPIKNITSQRLALALNKNGVDTYYCSGLEDCYSKIKTHNTKDNFILILGAGTIDQMCKFFAEDK